MRFIKTRNGSGPTRFLHVTGAGSSLGTSEDTIRSVFSVHGPVDVVLIDDKRFCFVVYSGTFIFLPISDDGHTIAANYVGCAQQQQHTPLFILVEHI